jgi:hypothetical protein
MKMKLSVFITFLMAAIISISAGCEKKQEPAGKYPLA